MQQSRILPTRRQSTRTEKRDIQCRTCPSLESCPTCPSGQMCQLTIPTSCAECPANTCVIDPAYHPSHRNASEIGGAIGGLLALFTFASLLYWVYRQRQRKAKEAIQRMRVATKLSAAEGEKFRPGAKSLAKSGTTNNPFRDGNSQGDNDDDKVPDEDTEWTELREDGLTAFQNMSGSIKDPSYIDEKNVHRKSMGAATHLSRITEGAEEDEEDAQQRLYAAIKRHTIREDEEVETRSVSSHVADSVDSRAEMGPGQSSSNPFSGGSEPASPGSTISPGKSRASSLLSGQGTAMDKGYTSINLQQPSAVHRPTGSPVVDLSGKEKPKLRSIRYSQLESPLTSLVRKPSRPARKPDLNLVLNNDSITDANAKRFSTQSKESGIIVSSPTLKHLSNNDGQEQIGFPASELLKSNAYRLNVGDADTLKGRHLSTQTASSIGTLSYIMSSPKIISPMDQGGVQRMQLKQGKAQLIRVGSQSKHPQVEAKMRGTSYEARIRNIQSADFSILDMDDDDEDEAFTADSTSEERFNRDTTHVPEEATSEREDEVEGELADARSLRSSVFPDHDESRLQDELANYPFKQATQ